MVERKGKAKTPMKVTTKRTPDVSCRTYIFDDRSTGSLVLLPHIIVMSTEAT